MTLRKGGSRKQTGGIFGICRGDTCNVSSPEPKPTKPEPKPTKTDHTYTLTYSKEKGFTGSYYDEYKFKDNNLEIDVTCHDNNTISINIVFNNVLIIYVSFENNIDLLNDKNEKQMSIDKLFNENSELKDISELNITLDGKIIKLVFNEDTTYSEYDRYHEKKGSINGLIDKKNNASIRKFSEPPRRYYKGGKQSTYTRTVERITLPSSTRKRVVYERKGTKYVKCIKSETGYITLKSAMKSKKK